MSSDNNDTITALATSLGEGAIGIIRLSGRESKKILEKIFKGQTEVDQFESHKMYLGYICHFENQPQRGAPIIDQVLAVWFKEGYSFTGEEVVEIHAHGSPFLLQQILKLLVELGARLAEPGEFSKRAFLNGKIDLTQAEAIADLISAKTEWQAKNALSQLGGTLSSTIKTIREKLIEVLARVEVGFDFSEEDIKTFDRQDLLSFLGKILSEIEILVDSFKTGQLAKDGLRIALIGKPNVGKSSLLNVLLNEERALVHHEPGTTRDVVTGERKIAGIVATFFDTAGIRKTSQSVEAAGIDRSRLILEKSDLVLLLLDSSQKLTKEDQALVELSRSKPCIIIYSKIDLPPAWESDQKNLPIVRLSSKNKVGLKELEEKIVDIMIKEKLSGDHNYVLNNVRHHKALKEIVIKLKEVTELLKNGGFQDDCLAEELRIMSNQLGSITGEITNEMVLDEIFQKFCIGK